MRPANRSNLSRYAFRAIESLELRRLLSVSTLFVDASSPGPTHDGSSWNSAYTDLQQALAAANPTAGNSVNIEVAKGTYKPTSGTDRNATFQLKDNVSLLGGYAGSTASNPNARDVVNN